MTQSNNEELEELLLVKKLLELPVRENSSALKNMDCWAIADFIQKHYLPRTELNKAVVEARIDEVQNCTRYIGDEYMERVGNPIVDGQTAAREQDRQFIHKMLRDRLAQLSSKERSNG